METQHSPAPWRVTTPPNESSAIFSGFRRVATMGHPDRTEPNETRDANARLIAAAPELLEALRKTISWAEIFSRDVVRNPSGPLAQDIAQARAAITKAGL